MSLTHGEIVINLDGTTYELRPTLKAMKKIQARFGGLRGAMDALTQLNVEHVAAIIVAGANVPPREAEAVEEGVFFHGVADATEQIVPFVTALINPRGASSDAPKKGKAQE